MEEMPNQERNIVVKFSDIMKKVRTKEDIINMMKKKVKEFLYNYMIIFSPSPEYMETFSFKS